jgi:hypothetical protein
MNKPLQMLTIGTSSDLWLGYGCPVSVHGAGETQPLDTMNPDHFGRSYLPDNGDPLKWFATTLKSSVKEIGEFYPFHGGAMISPRFRKIIEDVQHDGIEFLPLEIRHRSTSEVIDNWWFVNVVIWKEVFDLTKSHVKWEEFAKPLVGWAKLESKFGSKRITKIDSLVAFPAAYDGGLFLAKAPSEIICSRVFIGNELAQRLNFALPKSKKIGFESFLLEDRKLMPSY